MVLHVDRTRSSSCSPAHTAVVVGHGAEQVTKRVQDLAPAWANVVFVEQVEQNGTGDAAAIGMTAFGGDDYDDDATVVVAPRRRPAAAARHARRARRHPRRQRQRRHDAHERDRRPDRLRPRRARQATGGCCGSSSSATPRPRSSTITEVARASTRSGATCSVRRCATSRRQRPGRVLPDRRDRGAGEHGAPRRRGAGARPRPRASTTAGSWRCAERELRDRTNRHWLLNGVTMLDPRQTFIDVTVQLGRDVTLYPGTMLQGDTVVGDGTDIGPHTQLDDCVVGRGCAIRTRSGSTPRSATAPGSARTPICLRVRTSPTAPTTGSFYTARPTEQQRRRSRGASWRRSPPRSSRSTRGEPTRRSPSRWPATSGSARQPEHRRVRQR